MKSKKKLKKENILFLIIAIAFLVSTLIGLFLFLTAMHQRNIIIALADERYDWCISFNELKEVTDGLILKYVDGNFNLHDNLNCEILKPK